MGLNSLTYGKMSFAAMKKIEQEQGKHWFSKGDMAFFNTKLVGEPNKFNLFITSEENASWGAGRLYSVRMFNPRRGHVATIGEFHSFPNRFAAQKFMNTITNKLDLIGGNPSAMAVFDDLHTAEQRDGKLVFYSYGDDGHNQKVYEMEI
jgi:hypothetical protein